MTPQRRQWWVHNMIHVVLQMVRTSGNIVLLCNHGRSRSPMYLVAYLIIIHSMSSVAAKALVHELLAVQRQEHLDRFETLSPILSDIRDILI